jgi:hypothetical protein
MALVPLALKMKFLDWLIKGEHIEGITHLLN